MKAEFPMEFKECPICRRGLFSFFKRLWAKLLRKPYYTDTVCRLAVEELKEKGKIPQDAFASLEKIVVPLEQPQLVAAVSLLVCHYDVCAKCGTRYCTRVDKATGMAQPVGGGPQGRTPFPFSSKGLR